MNVPFFTLTRQYQALAREIDSAVKRVLEEGHFIMGPEVERFEQAMARYLGVPHVIAVANGTDALVMAMDVLGVGPGDEVITTAYTFFATSECISARGATPVFADIDPQSCTLDPAAVEAAVTPRTKAIIPVHLFGHPCDMDGILAVARRHNLAVVEDCAQAIGARYAGRPVGTFGVMGCFSLFPTKNLGCFGDGGFIVTADDGLADLLRKKRVHGSSPKYYHAMQGYNSRLDTIQAAIVLEKLPHLDGWNATRRAIAARYDAAFSGLPLRLTAAGPGRESVYHLYMAGAKDRAAFREALTARGIGTGLYYPLPLHLQQVYEGLGYRRGDLPECEAAADSLLALPCYPELTDEEQQAVIEAVQDYFAKGGH